jgi:putative multiple sugar transport system ATP-binding protein
MLKKVNLDVNPATKIKNLGVGKQQLIEIAKALSRDVKLLILDEPTSALNEDDIQNLFNLLRDLKNHGVTCVLISHKLREVIEVADTVTVLRDGQTITTLDAKKGKVGEGVLIKNMVGREIENVYPKKGQRTFGDIVLEVKNWNAYDPAVGRSILKDIHLNVRKGEIVGIAGLMGSGRTELALSMFGNSKRYKIHGEMLVHGKKINFNHPGDAIKAGVAYATEDRKGKGLILIQDVKQNITLANLKEISARGVINSNQEIKVANEYKDSLNIKTPTIEQKVGNLSGGNQQKVSVGKWLFVGPDVLILDEPTRGIDVGAKSEIYKIIRQLSIEGKSIIFCSSELPEILNMCDRIFLLYDGKIKSEMVNNKDIQSEKIFHICTGGK